ncbi:MAG: Mu transposase C-terminal domain-containing protein [Eubacteriales bacterium]|nr:Mu transposase C-terminal domain-containing protein [Eubacteriales bacterium]
MALTGFAGKGQTPTIWARKGGAEIIALWISTAEAAQAIGISDSTMRRRVNNGEFQIRIEDGCGGACKKKYLILVSSLPPAAQAKFQLDDLLEPVPVLDEVAAEDTVDVEPPAPATAAEIESRLSDEEYNRIMDEAWRKVAICEDAIALRQDPEYRSKLDGLMKQHNVPGRTLRRWVAKYESEGVEGLIHGKYRKAVAERRIHPALIQFIKAEYLKPHKPTAQYVYERTVTRAKELGLPAPSRATVYRIINEDILPGERVLGREGSEAFRKKVEPKARRDMSDIRKNEIWTGDGHTLPCFVNFGGRAIKPVFSVWEDMRTRVITGYTISMYDTSQSIGMALRHGILPKPGSPVQGIPEQAYTDNGKDYRSKHLALVYAGLRIDERFCTPRSPWTKPVERFFSTMHLRFTKYLPGYCGNVPSDRAERFNEKELLRQGKLLTPQQVLERFTEWLEQDYHQRRHSELGTSPLELYVSLDAARVEMPDERALDILLMKADEVKIYQDGIRRFQRLFWAEELMPFVGETVTVRYDPAHIGQLLVFRRGRFLCIAGNAELLSMRASESQVHEHIARQRRARKFFRQRLDELDAPLSEMPDSPVLVEATDRTTKPKVQMMTGFEKAARAKAEAPEDPLPADTAKTDRARDFLLSRADQLLKKQLG